MEEVKREMHSFSMSGCMLEWQNLKEVVWRLLWVTLIRLCEILLGITPNEPSFVMNGDGKDHFVKIGISRASHVAMLGDLNEPVEDEG